MDIREKVAKICSGNLLAIRFVSLQDFKNVLDQSCYKKEVECAAIDNFEVLKTESFDWTQFAWDVTDAIYNSRFPLNHSLLLSKLAKMGRGKEGFETTVNSFLEENAGEMAIHILKVIKNERPKKELLPTKYAGALKEIIFIEVKGRSEKLICKLNNKKLSAQEVTLYLEAIAYLVSVDSLTDYSMPYQLLLILNSEYINGWTRVINYPWGTVRKNVPLNELLLGVVCLVNSSRLREELGILARTNQFAVFNFNMKQIHP